MRRLRTRIWRRGSPKKFKCNYLKIRVNNFFLAAYPNNYPNFLVVFERTAMNDRAWERNVIWSSDGYFQLSARRGSMASISVASESVARSIANCV